MATAVAARSWQSIGRYAQIAGAAAFIAGLVLCLRHSATAICLIAGAAAFFVGKKLRGA
jgi:hypothetical protein